MRKTRLVILPTKCLHQMGFLLLFLSCPVIGDWGRIRPESEDSHNAIQIDREGTCGFERDPPGGLLNFLNENESKHCRLSEDLDSNTPAKSVERVIQTAESDEKRVDNVRRVNQRGNERILEIRMINERTVRKTIQRRTTDERRNIRRVVQRNVRNDVRSRSVESRESSSNRKNVRTRSLSLSRLESEQAVRSIHRQNNERNLRRNSERLHLNRRRSERQSKRKMEQHRRLTRESSNERQENDRTIRASERREREIRENARLTRSVDRERQEVRQQSNGGSIQELSMRRNDMTRRQTQERTQNVGRRIERRLSLSHRQQNDATRVERFENRRSTEQINLERRVPEIRITGSSESEGRKSDQREKLVRMTRSFHNRRKGNTRFVNLSPKASERNVRERRVVLGINENLEGMKSRRTTFGVLPRNQEGIPEVNLNVRKTEENFFEGVTKWVDLKSYESYKTGDWTTNCVIGAVIYYLSTRQIKAV